MVISLVIGSIICGVLTTKVGYYMPFLIFGICVSSIGAGLFLLLSVGTSTGQWIGYQIVYGFGLGACFQAPNMAAQTVLPRKEVSVGAALMLFAQTLFGAIFATVGQNVLDNQLVSRLHSIANITAEQIEQYGTTGLLTLIPAKDRRSGLEAYNASLRLCFEVALIMSCLAILGAAAMEWKNVKDDPAKPTPQDEKKNDHELPEGAFEETEKSVNASDGEQTQKPTVLEAPQVRK